MKKVIALILAFIMVMGMATMLSGCGSSEPCDDCGRTPTKSFKNEKTGEKEYYCEECSSDCAFCSHDATMHYTSGAGIIIFTCKDCYEEIKSLND